MRFSSPADRALPLLLPTLALVAEGAWVTVAYVAVQTGIDRQPPLLGTLEFAVAAGIAAFAVRRGWVKPDEDPVRLLALLAALGVIGWLWDESARHLVLSGDLLGAVSLHPGGWLTVVAAMRGIGHAFEVDDRAVTRLVLVGVPALAIPWTFGQITAGELRPIFVQEAFVASLTFVAAGFMAAGLARLQEIGRETGIDWRHDRSWLGTVLGVIVVVLALGVPAAMLLGLPGEAVARGVLGPIFGLLSYLFVAVLMATALVAALLAGALGAIGIELPPPMTPAEIAQLPVIRDFTNEQYRTAMTSLAVVWIVIVVVLLVLLRVWITRRRPRRHPTSTEERSFRLPPRKPRAADPSGASLLRARRGGEPRDAVGAYLAATDEIGRREASLGRTQSETPRAHAARIGAGRELGALQADYALARYANRTLTASEHARALGRWRRIRNGFRGIH